MGNAEYMGSQYSSDFQIRRIPEGIQFHFFFTSKNKFQYKL